MSEAPEQVWIYFDIDDEGEQYLELMPEHAHSQTDVTYIRADIHAARIADLEAQITQMTVAWGEDAVKVEELTRQLAEVRDKALEEAALRIEANPAPCSPTRPSAWTDDQIEHYEAGQADAASSFVYAIRKLKGMT